MQSGIRFIQISDTHIGNSENHIAHGINAYNLTQKLISSINQLTIPIDFILHSGDTVYKPDPDAFIFAQRLFSQFDKPVYYVNGNHDSSGITRKLNLAQLDYFNDSASFQFKVGNYCFLVLDNKGPESIRNNGIFTDLHEDIVNSYLQVHPDQTKIIFTHFPPIQLDVPWIDSGMLLLEGDRFHQIIKHSKSNAAVFFGHIHHRVTCYSDGVLYCSAPSPFCQFSVMPGDEEVQFESLPAFSCNYITITGSTIIVKELSFPLV